MQARMKNPALILPDAMQAILALQVATEQGGVPAATLGLVHLRASQINGCSVCVEWGTCHVKQAGESDERLGAVAAWREAPYFSEAERAAPGAERRRVARSLRRHAVTAPPGVAPRVARVSGPAVVDGPDLVHLDAHLRGEGDPLRLLCSSAVGRRTPGSGCVPCPVSWL
jgi:AhpD family alkylhydroperoxidase